MNDTLPDPSLVTDTSLVSGIAGSLLRHGLTVASGGLVTQGLITGDQQQQLVGALLALAGVALSVAEKLAARRGPGEAKGGGAGDARP